jgi:hypothetical protein
VYHYRHTVIEGIDVASILRLNQRVANQQGGGQDLPKQAVAQCCFVVGSICSSNELEGDDDRNNNKIVI